MNLVTKYKPKFEYHSKESNVEMDRWVFAFPNGYGCAVCCIKCNGRMVSHGNDKFPYELSVIGFTSDTEYQTVYDTEIGDGCWSFNADEVDLILDRIKEL